MTEPPRFYGASYEVSYEEVLASIQREQDQTDSSTRIALARVERARAEIQRLRDDVQEWYDTAHLINGMLDAADATLDRHQMSSAPAWDSICAWWCTDEEWGAPGHDWPCPDAAAVLDLFAPDTACKDSKRGP